MAKKKTARKKKNTKRKKKAGIKPRASGKIQKSEMRQSGLLTRSKQLKNTAPVEAIKGIGPKKGKKLRQKGIKTVKDLRVSQGQKQVKISLKAAKKAQKKKKKK